MTTPYVPPTYVPGDYLPRSYVAGLTVTLYLAPSPTGWRSTAVRSGPDPSFATSIRLRGQE